MALILSVCAARLRVLTRFQPSAFSAMRPINLFVGQMLTALAVGACGKADAASRTASSGVSAGAVAAAVQKSPGDTLTDSALIAKADRGRLMGRDSGAVWLVMISDFQCPYCKQWHDSSMAAVKRDYVDPGKVRVAYLNLPLPQHPHARMEAEASMCAGAQDKFWPYSEALFRDQNSLNNRADVKPYLDSIAKVNQLDMTEFARCRGTKAIKALIDSDIQQATRSGVRSTPSFLVGEFLVEGATPYPDFRRAIDTALITARTKRSR